MLNKNIWKVLVLLSFQLLGASKKKSTTVTNNVISDLERSHYTTWFEHRGYAKHVVEYPDKYSDSPKDQEVFTLAVKEIITSQNHILAVQFSETLYSNNLTITDKESKVSLKNYLQLLQNAVKNIPIPAQGVNNEALQEGINKLDILTKYLASESDENKKHKGHA